MRQRLYTPETVPGIRVLVVRLGVVLAVILAVTAIVYWEGGLKDSRSGTHPGFLDCLYFSVVTITTVGYGDIVPVETHSRLLDAFVLAPVRFFVILTIFGTAYQLAFRRLTEEYRMKRATSKLKDHIIVCGYGDTGQAAVRELLLQGTAPEQIVVLDIDRAALEKASKVGLVCVAGDATREKALQSVALERAANVLVCPGRDDTAVLITLTVRDLNPKAHVIGMCREVENARLLQRGGAHHVVSPAFAGGTLMAAATRQKHLVDTLEDMLTVGGTIQLEERAVTAQEVGKDAGSLAGMAIVRVYRGDEHYDVDKLPTLSEGDILVYVSVAGNA